MPLSYNPNDMKAGPAEGDYAFKVLSAEEKTFSTRNKGIELVIEFSTNDRILETWVRYVYTPGGLKYFKEMCLGVGLTYDPPPDSAKDFINKTGVALFKRDAKGFLEPVKIYPKEAAPQASGFTSKPVADDVPF